MSGQELALPKSVAERVADALELLEAHAARLALPDPDARRDPRALRWHKEARAESTRRAYRPAIQDYVDFCERTSRRDMPGHAMTMEAWTADLMTREISRGKNKGGRGMAPNTIRQWWSAVRTWHRVAGENVPDLALAGGVLEGYERVRANDPSNTDGRGVPGLRLPSLEAMFRECDPATNAGARDRALLSLGWAIMARRSELAALNIEDIEEVTDGLDVLVRRSKTDQLARGKKVAVPWKGELGELCPVVNTMRWKQRLTEAGILTAGFLRGVDRHDQINGRPGAGWAGKVSDRLAPETVELVIARAAIRAAVPNATKLRGHSLRRGGATDAYAGGADILAIARHGRWGERSPVIFRYIEDVDRWQRNALAGIGKGQVGP